MIRHDGFFDSDAQVLCEKIALYARSIGHKINWIQVSEHINDEVAVRISVLDPDDRNVERVDYVQNDLCAILHAGYDRADMMLGSFSTRH